MKIFTWMQRKLTKKPNSISANDQKLEEPSKEEISDWPHGLLTIGTFGNNSFKEDPERCNLQGRQSASQGQPPDLTPEEVVELQKELMLLIHKQVSHESNAAEDLKTHNVQLETFNFPPSLEDDRSNGKNVCGDSTNTSGQLLQSTRLKGKDICPNHPKKATGKKALSFLLKKMGMSRSMFAPTPSLRDPVPDKSTMEKIWRAILHKKVYPQNSSAKGNTKRYLESSHMLKAGDEDEKHDTANEGSKWVKADSEYIVLEI